MAVKFFGQFLLESGEIDEADLGRALELQAKRNRKFGEWATWGGYLTEAQADRINQAQRWTDRLFGELAVEFEYLTGEQVCELLARQEAAQVRLGEALVELGALQKDQLESLLDRFETEQRPYSLENRTLPEALRGDTLAELTLELLPKVALRSLCSPVKLGSERPWGGDSEFAFGASLSIRGKGGLDLALAVDRATAEAVAMAVIGVPEADCDRGWLTRGLGELLDALATNVLSHLDDGQTFEVSAPRPGVLPEQGLSFELVFHYGKGALIFAEPS